MLIYGNILKEWIQHHSYAKTSKITSLELSSSAAQLLGLGPRLYVIVCTPLFDWMHEHPAVRNTLLTNPVPPVGYQISPSRTEYDTLKH